MVSNSETESKTIEIVIDYLMSQGTIKRRADAKRASKGSGHDLVLPDGTQIEAKGTKQRKFNAGLRLNSEQEIEFFKNGGLMYRVLDVFGSPVLHIVKGKKDYLAVKQWAICTIPIAEQGEAIEITSNE